MIAILTRTSNRPQYFARCHRSVISQSIPCRHYVLYDTPEDIQYLQDKALFSHFVDRSRYEQTYKTPPPISAIPPILSLHNLYFNEIYERIEEDWVYHLDDDNYLLPNAFDTIIPYLNEPVDIALVRVRHFSGLLPRKWETKTLSFGGVDTGCFIVRKKLIQKVRWDGWKCGDYRVLEKCALQARKVLWFNKMVMSMDQEGLGRREDR